MILPNQHIAPGLQMHRFVHGYLWDFCVDFSCFSMFFRCRFRDTKNQCFWPPFCHAFGLLFASFSSLFWHRFLHGFWGALFPDFGLPLETLTLLFQISGRKRGPKRVRRESRVPARAFQLLGLSTFSTFFWTKVDFWWILGALWVPLGGHFGIIWDRFGITQVSFG